MGCGVSGFRLISVFILFVRFAIGGDGGVNVGGGVMVDTTRVCSLLFANPLPQRATAGFFLDSHYPVPTTGSQPGAPQR